MNNSKGEWYVAYHSIARGKNPKQVSKILGIFIKVVLNHRLEEKNTNDHDLRHSGKTCELGVYVSPYISYAEGYTGKTKFNDEEYKCVLMLRINPEKLGKVKYILKNIFSNLLQMKLDI